MATNSSNTHVDFRVNRALFYPNDSGEPANITGLITSFNYVEDVTSPFVAATLNIVDSSGFINSAPIQGGEEVVIAIQPAGSDQEFEYSFRCWQISNRFARQQKQAYVMNLISGEAIQNELTRIRRSLSGNPESIVVDLVSNELKSGKPVYSEPSLFEMKFIANMRRPFDIIADIAVKCVSPKADYSGSAKPSQNKAGGTQTNKIKGSGGFFFWENYRGFNFFAVDSLCADDKSKLKSDKLEAPAWGPYVERLGGQDDTGDTRFHILESQFASEINLLESMRKGKYSSLLVFFNHSTGQYEEYVYKLSDTYSNMAHLGGQESLSLIPVQNIDLSEYPTRIMSMLLDHESWYNEVTPASPEDKDGSTSPAKFADWTKYYAAQSIARYQLLKNQICTIVVPGNASICAGDKIDIRLVNKVGTADGRKDPFDKESSGVYLIMSATHNYDLTEGSNGKFYTTLRLVRDSFGMKDTDSNHGNK